MTRLSVLCFLALAACASAPLPTSWTRADGRVTDPARLEADKAACQGEMEQAQRITSARSLAPITLPGQESPAAKVYTGCMAQHGYAAAK